MNTQQKIADILMLVEYVKEHVEMEPHNKQNKQLDEIGLTAVSMLDILRKLDTKMNDDQEDMFTSYKTAIDTMSGKILDQLKTMVETIKETGNVSNTVLNRIEETYSTYGDTLKENTEKLTAQNTEHDKNVQELSNNVESLKTTIDDLGQKVLSKGLLDNVMNNIQNRISELTKQDQELNASYERYITATEKMTTTVAQSSAALNETLESVDDSFKTSVGRLDMILMKMDLFTKSVGGESDDSQQ